MNPTCQDGSTYAYGRTSHQGTTPTEFEAGAPHRAPLSLDLLRRGATRDNQSTAPKTPNKVACLPDPPEDHAYRV